MIYFDNAATTKFKPDEVYDAANYYLREVGVSPGRGSYTLGIQASRMLYQARCTLGDYFGMTDNTRVVFTKNSTEAINLFFNGFLAKGDHVIISCYEHNAVLRPLHKLKERGVIDYTVITRDDLKLAPDELFLKYARKNTKLIALTLASNLTGRIIFNRELFMYFHRKGIFTFIDSSQGAGLERINMKEDGIDFLAFTGHKDLLGLPGAGGLCCESTEKIEPLIQGGTGLHGENYTNPSVFPEGYEAGTLNMPSIWALRAGVKYIQDNSLYIQSKENELNSYLLSKLLNLEKVTVYDAVHKRVPTCGFNIKGFTSDKIVSLLDKKGICVRGGIHCSILAHEALGTVKSGMVRVSLGYKNTKDEVDELISIIKDI